MVKVHIDRDDGSFYHQEVYDNPTIFITHDKNGTVSVYVKGSEATATVVKRGSVISITSD